MSKLPPLDALKPEDKRKEPRQRVLGRAKLYVGMFSPTVYDCLIMEYSDNGARIETSAVVQVPDLFKIQVGEQPARRARRVWSRGNAVGLEFLDPPPSA
nr:PilZ domain-containing protein [uncultured Acidocella sp.]